MSVEAQIVERTRSLPEGALIAPKAFLHIGSRAAVDQALSRLARKGELMRVGRGRYVRPISTRFGQRGPTPEELVARLSQSTGEIIVSGGAAAAQRLGLTTQVPIRPVYLTSGSSRTLQLGKQTVELRNAPGWQLWRPHAVAGEVVRALAWLGPEEAPAHVAKIVRRLPRAEREGLSLALGAMPGWLARLIGGSLAEVSRRRSRAPGWSRGPVEA